MSIIGVDNEMMAKALYRRYGKGQSSWQALPEHRKDRWRQDATDVGAFSEEEHARLADAYAERTMTLAAKLEQVAAAE